MSIYRVQHGSETYYVEAYNEVTAAEYWFGWMGTRAWPDSTLPVINVADIGTIVEESVVPESACNRCESVISLKSWPSSIQKTFSSGRTRRTSGSEPARPDISLAMGPLLHERQPDGSVSRMGREWW